MAYNRKFLSSAKNYDSWKELKSFCDSIIDAQINSVSDLQELLLKRNELKVVVEEQCNWVKLNTWRFVGDKEVGEKLSVFTEDIWVNYSNAIGLINRRISQSEYLPDLIKTLPEYRNMLMKLKSKTKVFNRQNIPVLAELDELIKRYNTIATKQKL